MCLPYNVNANYIPVLLGFNITCSWFNVLPQVFMLNKFINNICSFQNFINNEIFSNLQESNIKAFVKYICKTVWNYLWVLWWLFFELLALYLIWLTLYMYSIVYTLLFMALAYTFLALMYVLLTTNAPVVLNDIVWEELPDFWVWLNNAILTLPISGTTLPEMVSLLWPLVFIVLFGLSNLGSTEHQNISDITYGIVFCFTLVFIAYVILCYSGF